MAKDDGVHDYFFGQQPEMPWKRHKNQLESFIELIRDAEVGKICDLKEVPSASDFTSVVFMQDIEGKFSWKASSKYSDRTITSRRKNLLNDAKKDFLKKCNIPEDKLDD